MSIDEEKISSLYQQNKNQETNEAPDEMPSAQLDSDILKAAHQAVDKKPSSVKSPFSGGWPAVTSIAAVLIITVILVPLIKQEAVSPTTESIVEKKLEALSEQDAIGQSNVRDMNIDTNIKAKKQSLAKEQARRLAPALSSREKSSKITQDQAFTVEEPMSEAAMPEKTMAPRATEIIASPQVSKPTMATMGKSNLYDDETKAEIKTETEFQQQSTPMLTADKAPAITLTPKLWLEKIRRLIEQDKLDLAKEELEQFKTKYPDKTIDQSILNSLQD